ncbi:transcriptional regulator, Acidobacterial, PadR-family [Acholeplasma oculi]|uniref:PadR family transcriptional regulator n=1 Tax=Acholeplasma oculi TaxID=35623 RepID=A0A061ABB0_9MOLU|nr:PadR family transcriptional regulator [Acholeplasma oculi]CDR30684.1 PadR family transcriptional regulator [Acholeplasma oculi]SKC34654.1 PadR family transcriptional regulator, regulatory protein PadR [Acholeplasma oculi]SUT89486.1 transcriptional regulator, Acidobacterial, PadR-family [Acholeplasma oculi]
MNTQFKKGILDLCILYVINEHEMYGFEIIEKLSTLLDVNENTIYPILRRLTEQELFETYTKVNPLGADRKYYRITQKGIEQMNTYLREWYQFIDNVNKILKEKSDE